MLEDYPANPMDSTISADADFWDGLLEWQREHFQSANAGKLLAVKDRPEERR